MSTGDVVCTGWLIKSPPEKKLKRYTWRKRWFVLRCGRMSGNPDVLEYYQSKSSKKPIRTIDLKECEVQIETTQLLLKRQFHEKHPFAVKTSSRIFYLVAKTEEEMKSWIKSISQICQFGILEDTGLSKAGLADSPTFSQPSPATALMDNADQEDHESMLNQLESGHPLDYLFLSQCETGGSTSSFSNSEGSLEQKSSDSIMEDILSSTLYTNFSSSLSHNGHSPSFFPCEGLANPPFSAPPWAFDRPYHVKSSSSPQPQHCASSVFQFDKLYSSVPLEAPADRQAPPPRPPKPSHNPEKLSNRGAHGSQAMSAQQLTDQPGLISRRITFSGLDQFRRGDFEATSIRNKRLSLNLSPFSNSTQAPNSEDDSYVPMLTPSFPLAAEFSDGYIPMSPRRIMSPMSKCTAESPLALGSVTYQCGDLVPPPINRHLKPRRRARPPPLDLRGLSTIRECPPRVALTRTMTDISDVVNCLLLDRRPEDGETKGDENTYCTEPQQQHFLHGDGPAPSWARKSNLDYLSLDFNSASPSPVQKQKAFLSDEYKVDYVQVDEQKTQALQNTRMEWTDVRQSKA
ncbi:GRB2-associated-binding protein 3 [Lampris incognitus]|uniref:GRB2-associated-binding protein 3 n=1 Tax=Lampris incognitus TaxID=2546036 RepID=UPI0024B57B03|nr:GRB2-associated-binding protein 3 [Lampris incognitus]